MAAKDGWIAEKDAVYKLQLSLLEGIQNENQLFAAGSLMSCKDYEDVVTERSIVNLCGYPLCRNLLPSDRSRKGRYRISSKEHMVYDLRETYMFCSSNCVVNSRAFAGTLQGERSSALNPEKLNSIMRLFENLSLQSEEDKLGKNRDLRLNIHEKTESNAGDVSLEQWIGPSNAIEGYVPQKKKNYKPSPFKNHREGSNASSRKSISEKNLIINEMDFMSAIILEDEYSISKSSPVNACNTKTEEPKENEIHKDLEDQFANLALLSAPIEKNSDRKSSKPRGKKSKIVEKDKLSNPELPSTSNFCQTGSDTSVAEAEKDFHNVKAATPNDLKTSLKSAGGKKFNRSVTWADQKIDNVGSRDVDDDDNISRFASAEACAVALSQAVEAVASGDSDAMNDVSEAGIIILPRSHNGDEEDRVENVDMLEPEPEPAPVKWPRKPGIPQSDLFDPENSWHDDPPEGFSLTLSPFATMWMALFEWITSSSLAYIYGRDESIYEDYLTVNGREYPRRIVLEDGRSSEIKQTLAACLSRALPGLVSDLRLPIPVSSLEQGMGCLLETMSFLNALPAFSMKQWQLIILLFFEGLSVCSIPELTQHMTNGRMLVQKVLDGARISVDEYEVMKDLMIPLGRAPHFSTESGA
ncbi:RPAP2_Rtr1 domain-containing protein [Cephalotus follicularis]|uniref:RNA polymerase II subunit B1 CTD phosphatase RPAP2 homolog n=1 Tax=Cephalotus follicularis TaxID=3775 RepID=A0A1Q3D9W1_CEPFO|nr:RPAP2_Rtr1 domain-containing protein [Cephalotus follicularis]